LNKVILSEKKQERCYDLDTVQAGMPMTVKVMGIQALACFPSLVSPRKHDFNGLSRRDCLTAIASLPVSLHWQPFNFR
jgi:hypothetical protein